MNRPQHKRHPPFVTLPRHKRSHEVVLLKGRMRHEAGEYGGRFSSHHVLNEPGRPDLYNQWIDVYFPGTNRFTIWNAEIVTARRAFWDAVHHEACSRAYAKLGDGELSSEAKLEFEPADYSRTGKVVSYRLVRREPVRYAKFDGRTLSEQIELLETQIIRDEPPVIYESFKLDMRYAYGIGLQIVLDVDVINQASVEAAIDRVFAAGEIEWASADPVPRDHLPWVNEREALAAAMGGKDA